MPAARSIQLTVFGDKDLEKAFNALALNAQKKVFRPALRAGMKLIHRAVLAKVPVDTGALKGAIKLRASPRKRGRIGLAVFIDGALLPKRGKGGTREWFYPAHVELGYLAGGSKDAASGQRTGGQLVPPRSFLRAGFDEAKEAALTTFEAEVGRRMEALFLHPEQSGGDGEGEE